MRNINKAPPWKNEDICWQRSILISSKRKFEVCSSTNNKEIANKEAQNLAEFYNQKREHYLYTRCDEINNMNAERKFNTNVLGI